MLICVVEFVYRIFKGFVGLFAFNCEIVVVSINVIVEVSFSSAYVVNFFVGFLSFIGRMRSSIFWVYF